MKDLALTIRTLREKMQLTQEQLGDALGVSRAAVQSWESGQITPRPKRLEKLAKALGTTVSQLVAGGPARPGGSQNVVIAVQFDGAELPIVAVKAVEPAMWAKTRQKVIILTEKSGRKFGIVATPETIEALTGCLEALREFP